MPKKHHEEHKKAHHTKTHHSKDHKEAVKKHAHHMAEASYHIKGAEKMMERIHSEMQPVTKKGYLHDPKTKMIGGKVKIPKKHKFSGAKY